MSNSGICHDTGSKYYERTKNFTPYNTLNDCLNAGGRLPKGHSGISTTAPARQTTPASSDYDRAKFGHGWADDDKDCLNTRHELLKKLSTSTTSTGKNKCTIERGRWLDPYTNQTFYNAKDMDIDHLVPLKWAWEHGAGRWSDDKRERFANDPANLFPVKASVNRAKGAKGPLEWLPPYKNFHCQYVTRFIRVMKTYGLQLSGSEQQAINQLQGSVCR